MSVRSSSSSCRRGQSSLRLACRGPSVAASADLPHAPRPLHRRPPIYFRALAVVASILVFAGLSFAAPLRVALIPPCDRPDVVDTIRRLSISLGFTADALSPEQMVNASVFNPRRYQAAVYTGSERYLYQVHRPGDAVSALMDYLAAGGTLIVAGHCWPFYRPCRWDGHDFVRYEGPLPTYRGPRDRWLEQQMARLRQSPVGTFNRFLGLNIAGEGTVQFERPPEDDKISFVLTDAGRKLFPDLPPRIPFPASGDLRFRPASSRNLPAGVRYTSIAVAVGTTGKKYGDAICLIEHTSGRLAGGVVIYVWGTLVRDNLAAPILLDALAIAGERAGCVACKALRRADDLSALLRQLAAQTSSVTLLPERSYFSGQVPLLLHNAALARAAARLGNAVRAEIILSDVEAAATLLRRRISALGR